MYNPLFYNSKTFYLYTPILSNDLYSIVVVNIGNKNYVATQMILYTYN